MVEGFGFSFMMKEFAVLGLELRTKTRGHFASVVLG